MHSNLDLQYFHLAVPCVISFLTYSALYPLFWSLSSLLSLKQLYTSLYTVRIASHYGNHGYFTEKQNRIR